MDDVHSLVVLMACAYFSKNRGHKYRLVRQPSHPSYCRQCGYQVQVFDKHAHCYTLKSGSCSGWSFVVAWRHLDCLLPVAMASFSQRAAHLSFLIIALTAERFSVQEIIAFPAA